jgi:Fe-S cluster assembly scaffold protein SufB
MSDIAEIYSSIPMRTWRWLGVNEARLPQEVPAETEKASERIIHVAAGRKEQAVVVYRQEARAAIRAEVEDGAELDLIKVQLLPTDKNHVDDVQIKAGKEAKVKVTMIEAGGRESVAKLAVDLAGDNAVADVWGIYFGDGTRKIDLNYIIRQRGRHTDANMQIHGALKDQSDKIFRGTLDFQRGTKGSIGRENEEVVLLDEGVRNRSVPLMLSHEDDVDGHHAVSIGKMDQAKLFYLMSRGLDLSEAQRLVIEASFNPVLARIPDASLREELDTYLKGRLSDG